jgi:hypothetical protein
MTAGKMSSWPKLRGRLRTKPGDLDARFSPERRINELVSGRIAASAHAVVTSSAMVQISLIREGAPAEKPLPKLTENIG